MLQEGKCLVQKELGFSKAAGLQTGTGRASSANSPALGSGKGRRRINQSPQLMLWKSHTLLRGSQSAHKGWHGARNDLSPAQEQLQEVLGMTSTINPHLHCPNGTGHGAGCTRGAPGLYWSPDSALGRWEHASRLEAK